MCILKHVCTINMEMASSRDRIHVSLEQSQDLNANTTSTSSQAPRLNS